MPGSDTGAFEAAMWSLLGARGVDVLAWESFGSGWVSDVVKQLKLADVRKFEADYGRLPDLASVDFSRDVVFTANGTTSGVQDSQLRLDSRRPRRADAGRCNFGGVRAAGRLGEGRLP